MPMHYTHVRLFDVFLIIYLYLLYKIYSILYESRIPIISIGWFLHSHGAVLYTYSRTRYVPQPHSHRGGRLYLNTFEKKNTKEKISYFSIFFSFKWISVREISTFLQNSEIFYCSKACIGICCRTLLYT